MWDILYLFCFPVSSPLYLLILLVNFLFSFYNFNTFILLSLLYSISSLPYITSSSLPEDSQLLAIKYAIRHICKDDIFLRYCDVKSHSDFRDDGGSKHLRNAGLLLRDYTKQYFRSLSSSYSSL
jgi:hypothetical protein